MKKKNNNNLDCNTFADASQAPDTKDLLSGESDRLITSPVWPLNVVVCCPVSMSHKALKTNINFLVNINNSDWYVGL